MNPYLLLGGLVASIGMAVGGYVFGHHVEAQTFDKYVAQQAAIAEKSAADSQAAARAAEQSAEQKQMTIASTYQEQIDALTKTRDSLISAAGAGTQRVYVRVAGPGPNGVPGIAPGGPSNNAVGGAALDLRSSSFFLDEFAAADSLADQLAAAQQVIEQDRVTCNGKAP